MSTVNHALLTATKLLMQDDWKMSDAYEHLRNRKEHLASMNGMTARKFQTIYWSRAAGPYSCEQCTKEFDTPQGLGAHRRVHKFPEPKPDPRPSLEPTADDRSGFVELITATDSTAIRRALIGFLADMNTVIDQHVDEIQKLFR